MMQFLKVSPSPHIHSGDSVKRNMYGVIIAMIPVFLMSLYTFGLGALVVMLTSVLACMFFEYLIVRFLLKQQPSLSDGSAIITGMLLAFNIPTNLPVWIILIGSLFAIGVAKLSYGGLGRNLFNPALAGRVFMLISFPVQMTSWPLPLVNRGLYIDATTGATPLAIIKEGLKNGQDYAELLEKVPSYFDMLFGFTAGSAGEMSAVAILLGLAYMLWRKIITWHIPLTIIMTIFMLTGLLKFAGAPAADPILYILSGGALLGAVFMATDYVTSPMTARGMIVYALGIGVLTVVIRIYGAYPEGISFAILIMNAFTPLINTYIKPPMFGKPVKVKAVTK